MKGGLLKGSFTIGLVAAALSLWSAASVAGTSPLPPAPEHARIAHVESLRDDGRRHEFFAVERTDVRGVVWMSTVELELSMDHGLRKARLVRYDEHCEGIAAEHRLDPRGVCDNIEAWLGDGRIDAVFQSAWSNTAFAFELAPDPADREVLRMLGAPTQRAPGIAVRTRTSEDRVEMLWVMKDRGEHRVYSQWSARELAALDVEMDEAALVAALDLFADAADFGFPGRIPLPREDAGLADAVPYDLFVPIECMGGRPDEFGFCTDDESDDVGGEGCKSQFLCDYCSKLPGNGYILDECGSGGGGGGPIPLPAVPEKPDFRAKRAGPDSPRILSSVTDSFGVVTVKVSGGFKNASSADASAKPDLFWNSASDEPATRGTLAYVDIFDWASSTTGLPSFGRCAVGQNNLNLLAAGSTANDTSEFECHHGDSAALPGYNVVEYKIDARKEELEASESNNGGLARGRYFLPFP